MKSIKAFFTSILAFLRVKTYVCGEIVKLKVTNNLDIPIWYIGYPQRDLVFWELERAQSDGWQGMDFRLPVIEETRVMEGNSCHMSRKVTFMNLL